MPRTYDKLGQYITDFQTLQVGFENLLEDIDFQLKQGGTIHYAVDFSEIYAYGFIGLETTPNNIFVFSSEMNSIEKAALEHLILKHLFTAYSGRMILLPPYADELRRFWKRQSDNDFMMIAREASNTYSKSIRKILRENLQPLSVYFGQSEWSDAERQVISKQLREHLPDITTLFSPPSRNPWARIKKLITDETFKSIQDIAEFEPIIQTSITDWWYEQLTTPRSRDFKPLSSQVDLLAIALVEQVNRHFEEEGILTRVRIVTRSNNMHDIYQRTFSKEIQNAPPIIMGNILRHPSMFNILSLLSGMELEEQKNEIETRLRFVTTFLADASNSRLEDPLNIDQDTRLRDIKKDWLSQERLSIAISELTSGIESFEGSGIGNEVRRAMEVLKDPDRLQPVALETYRDFYREIESTLKDFSDKLQLERFYESISSNILAAITFERKDQHFVLNTSSLFISYNFEFYTMMPNDLLEKIKQEDNVLLLNFTKVTAYAYVDRYEIWLFEACIAGTVNNWNIAEICCEQALTGITNDTLLLSSEAYLFYAVCMRKRRRTTDRYIRALEYLDNGLKSKRRFSADAASHDVRFVAERGIQILLAHVDLASSAPFSVDQGFEQLEHAEQMTNDEKIIVAIYHARLIYWIFVWMASNDISPETRKRILEHKKYLEDIQRRNSKHECDWSPMILLSIAQVKWMEEGRGYNEHVIDMINCVKQNALLSSDDIKKTTAFQKLIASERT